MERGRKRARDGERETAGEAGRRRQKRMQNGNLKALESLGACNVRTWDAVQPNGSHMLMTHISPLSPLAALVDCTLTLNVCHCMSLLVSGKWETRPATKWALYFEAHLKHLIH